MTVPRIKKDAGLSRQRAGTANRNWPRIMHMLSDRTENVRGITGERHLGELLDTLQSRAWLILACALGAAVVAGGVSFLQPRQYRATALVLVSSSKLPTGDAARADASLLSETFATLLRSRVVAERVVKDLGPNGMTAERLAAAVTVRAVPGTMLLRVSLDHPDPSLAVRILDAQTTRVVSLNRELRSADLSDARNYLHEQVTDAGQALTTQEQKLTSARATLQVEALKERLKTALSQRATLIEVRDERAQEAARFGAQARGYREALAKQGKTLVLNRSIAEDGSALPDIAALSSGASRDQLLGLQLKTEVINPLYEATEPLLAKAQAEEQGALAELAGVKAQLSALDAELTNLQKQLAERDSTQTAAQREFELAKSAYEGFAKSYESARVSVAAQNADMRVVEAATASAAPVSPRPLMNAVAAGLAALLLGVFTTLVYAYVREDRRPVVTP